VTRVGDKATAGVMKDTVNMTRMSSLEIDFVADDPGPSLLLCHRRDHQDKGFMGLMTYSLLGGRRQLLAARGTHHLIGLTLPAIFAPSD
jgi:hypothetical protein